MVDPSLFGDEVRRLAAQALAADGSAKAIRLLTDVACWSDDESARAAACTALRSLPEGFATDTLCNWWASSRHPTLEALLVEGGLVARQPAELRVLSALKANRLELLDARNAHIAVALVLASSDADAEIARRATDVLGMTRVEAQEALCRMAVESGDQRALAIAARAGSLPKDPLLRVALLALSGRWEDCETFDFDGVHLRGAYGAASPELRRRLAASAREAGCTEWVQVAVGGRQRRRLADMTRDEWHDVVALLADPVRANEAWRLAQEAPPFWGRALLLGIGDGSALSECNREDVAHLRALAVLCGEGEIPFSGSASSLATLRGHEDSVTSLAVTPGGGLLASGSSDKTIGLWRLPGGECAATLRGHENSVTSLAVTPDGRLLASGSEDNTIRLWRLPDGECVATLRGHESGVTSLTVTSDGSLLASGGSDNSIRVWRLPDCECVATLGGHEDPVCSLAVTPDGRLLASGSCDRTIRLWRLPPPVAALVAAPVAVLASDIDRLLALRGDDRLTERERAWLGFMLALVDHHRRFDIEVVVVDHVEVGKFDIEIGS